MARGAAGRKRGRDGAGADVRAQNRRLRALLRMRADAQRAFFEKTAAPAELLRTIVRHVAEVVGDSCTIVLLSDDGRMVNGGATFSCDARVGALLEQVLAKAPFEVASHPLLRDAVESGRPLLLGRVGSDAIGEGVGAGLRSLAQAMGFRSILAAPVRSGARVFGVLWIGRTGPRGGSLDEDDVAVAQDLADHAALAIANARLIEGAMRELEVRRRAEAERERFATLVDRSTDLIAIADLDGFVSYMNDAGVRLVGLSSFEEARRRRIEEFVPEEDIETTRRAVRAVVDEGAWRGAVRLRHFRTRAPVEAHASAFLLRDETGAPCCLAAIVRDLTETKRLEEQFRHAQKMEAVGRLAGGVAHDFNNLLSVILSYADLAARALPTDDPIREDLSEIDKAGRRAVEVTRQLLAFSRQQVLQPRVLDAVEVVGGMEKMIRRLVGEDIAFDVVRPAMPVRVKADPGQIEQILLNLVVNARDAMPQGGRLAVEIAPVDVGDDAAWNEPGVAPGRYVAIAVADTGVGMDAQVLAHIFEPFFTTKEAGKGTGLGLSTVYGLVKQSGGHVAVESEKGRGSTFRVFLPRVDDAEAALAVAQPSLPPTSRGPETVLLVEDEDQLRVLGREILRRAGYEVLDARNAGEAILAVERHEGPIHLLLTDVVMPGLNGVDLADRLRAARPAMRVLFMSGYAHGAVLEGGVLRPGAAFLQKPITPDVLARKVREVLDSGE